MALEMCSPSKAGPENALEMTKWLKKFFGARKHQGVSLAVLAGFSGSRTGRNFGQNQREKGDSANRNVSGGSHRREAFNTAVRWQLQLILFANVDATAERMQAGRVENAACTPWRGIVAFDKSAPAK
ncbi:MAG: hypothetical protein ETSY1_45870 [Candidatus Entotheonella factor]|uniref:Uncharacterized protein n=1 Tax=Entotheonella factor TaxID=1429438 RepID=W4L2S5_ENTF1|nr:MAG: hypothetical protein ETSY1_45870 [Candidatus Entotheonella factor]